MREEGYRTTLNGNYDPIGLSPEEIPNPLPEEIRSYLQVAKRGQTTPSSTRKKLVKEGNRKFIGPRQLSSEVAEDLETRGREQPRVHPGVTFDDIWKRWSPKGRVTTSSMLSRMYKEFFNDNLERSPQEGTGSVSPEVEKKLRAYFMKKRNTNG